MGQRSARLAERVRSTPMGQHLGRIHSFNGLVVESAGPDARVGELCEIVSTPDAKPVEAEVMGFKQQHLLLMPHGHLGGISTDSLIRATGNPVCVPVGNALLGRVVNAFCAPIDDLGDIRADDHYPLYREPINPLKRAPIEQVLETGIRAIDGLLTLGVGQRMGIFAGSGVGKSTLLGMLGRQVSADVTVLALIGERGREVGEFLTHSLGVEGLKRSVVVVATSDEPAVVRAHATHAAHAIAEFFRDQGKSVLLILDSMTRFAMAQREIGLAIGEPPTFRGYTPSVFSRLPTLLERCGRLTSGGSITGVYSVLVEGDDMNEPVTDHMRAILDGHIMLTRDIAARGHHPAIDVLHSTSRVMGQIVDEVDARHAEKTKKLLAKFESSRDLIELGAYQAGVNLELDDAVRMIPTIEGFLRQTPRERVARQATLAQLTDIASSKGGAP